MLVLTVIGGAEDVAMVLMLVLEGPSHPPPSRQVWPGSQTLHSVPTEHC